MSADDPKPAQNPASSPDRHPAPSPARGAPPGPEPAGGRDRRLHDELAGAIADAQRLGGELERFERAAAAAAAAGVSRRRGGLLIGAATVLVAAVVAGWALGLGPAGLRDRLLFDSPGSVPAASSPAGTAADTPADTSAGPPAQAVSGPAGAAPGAAPAAGCPRLRVVAAAAIAPVLDAVAAGLRSGPDCLSAEVGVADGRSAGAAARAATADVWVPDDAAWAATAPQDLLPVVEPEADGGAIGPVLATSPLLLVTDPGSARRLATAGGGWAGLDRLLSGPDPLRLVAGDPQRSGDGLLALGGLGEAVWLAEGMDASAAALMAARRVTRTVAAPDQVRPERSGEVAVLPEFRLPASVPTGSVLLAPRDRTASLRFSWLVTRAGLADPVRAAAADRLAAAVAGPAGRRALAAAGLRGPDGRPLPGTASAASRPPSGPAGPALPVLAPHHVEHVFATWYPRDRAVDLLVVVDVSGSMVRRPPGADRALITLVKEGCRSVDDLLPDQAGLGLWEFGVRLDGASDHRELVPPGPLDADRRRRLDAAVSALVARRTDTGLYDTVLAAYRSAVAGARPGVPAQVMVFTDGRDEGDRNTVGAAGLSRELAAVKASDPAAAGVSLSVMSFGSTADATELERVLAPVGGYVDRVGTAAEVAEAFLHLAAGGLHA